MNMLMKIIIAAPIFFAIDMIWLGLVAKNYYREQLNPLLSDQTNWTAAIVFYLFYIFALVFFVVQPQKDADLLKIALHGALFGAVAYATYDLTNLATLKDWPLQLAIVDIIWGAVLTASVATLTIIVARLIV